MKTEGADGDAPRELQSRKIFGIVSTLVVLSGIGLGAYYLTLRNKISDQIAQYETFTEYQSQTRAENLDYAAAEMASRMKEYDKALSLYRDALLAARNIVQRTQIKFMIAITTSRVGDYMAAIPLYKEVVAEDASDSTRIIRAYALQTMVNQYDIFADPRILDEIFKDEPYASLWVANDIPLSLRHLYEYAAAIYPIAESEYKIAGWYAGELLYSRVADAEVENYKAAMRQAFELGDADLNRLYDEPLLDYDVTRAELRRAVTLGILNRYGDFSFGDAEEYFETVMSHFAQLKHGHDAIVRYSYAIHLALMPGNERTNDIKNLVSPFYTDPTFADAGMVAQLKNARQSAYYRRAGALVADADPDFKRYLVSLGWTEDDFQI